MQQPLWLPLTWVELKRVHGKAGGRSRGTRAQPPREEGLQADASGLWQPSSMEAEGSLSFCQRLRGSAAGLEAVQPLHVPCRERKQTKWSAPLKGKYLGAVVSAGLVLYNVFMHHRNIPLPSCCPEPPRKLSRKLDHCLSLSINLSPIRHKLPAGN